MSIYLCIRHIVEIMSNTTVPATGKVLKQWFLLRRKKQGRKRETERARLRKRKAPGSRWWAVPPAPRLAKEKQPVLLHGLPLQP